MERFINESNAFNYIFEKDIAAGEVLLLKMPSVSPNKRGINDIGWMTNSPDLKLLGTMSRKPTSDEALWVELADEYYVNKTISAFKIDNSKGAACKICIRVILN